MATPHGQVLPGYCTNLLDIRMVYGALRETGGTLSGFPLPSATVYRVLRKSRFATGEHGRPGAASAPFEERFPEESQRLREALSLGGYPMVPFSQAAQPLERSALPGFREAGRALVERIAFNAVREYGSVEAARKHGYAQATTYRHLKRIFFPKGGCAAPPGTPEEVQHAAKLVREAPQNGFRDWAKGIPALPPFAEVFPERERVLLGALAIGGYPAYCVSTVGKQFELFEEPPRPVPGCAGA